MSTPPLSQRIQELEAELGLTLFERSSRKVALTDAGRLILDEARIVLASIDRLECVASSLRSPLDSPATTPPLALGFCQGSESIARVAARRFHDRWPETAIRPAALTTLRMFDDILSGRLTIGIVRGPIPHPGRLASRLLCASSRAASDPETLDAVKVRMPLTGGGPLPPMIMPILLCFSVPTSRAR